MVPGSWVLKYNTFSFTLTIENRFLNFECRASGFGLLLLSHEETDQWFSYFYELPAYVVSVNAGQEQSLCWYSGFLRLYCI
jgi:hypothetical protein